MPNRFQTVSPLQADVLAAIHHESFPDAWSTQEFGALLEDPLCTALLLCDNGHALPEPMGFVLWRQVVDEAEIITIATRPVYRRQGVGQQMMTACLEALREKAAATLFLEVAEDNTPAQALYLGCGFRLVGRRRGYYPPIQAGGVVRDALVLSYFLT